MMNVTLWIAVLAGFVSFLSPCVFPLVPAYIGYMSGRVSRTVAAQGAGGNIVFRTTTIDRVSTLLHGVAFVAGFTLVFVGLGLLTTAFIRQVGGQNIALFKDIIGRVGGLLIIFFGMQFMGVVAWAGDRLLASRYINSALFSAIALIILAGISLWALVDPLIALPVIIVIAVWFFVGGAFNTPKLFWTKLISFLQRSLYADTRRQMAVNDNKSFGASLLLGIIFAAGWTPCIGPIYGSILTMAATGGDVGQAAALMIAYSLGLGIPFLICAILLDSAQGLLRRMRRYIHTIEVVSGAFLVFVGILVATGRLQTLSQNFATQFADLSYTMEDCAVRISEGEIGITDFFNCVNDNSQPTTDTTANESS
jgi:cytochrome c-type biogenesis protein